MIAGGGRSGMEFRLLGSLEVRAGGRPVRIGSPKLRVLLARLLLDPGRPVSTWALAEAIWGDRLPGNPRRAVQVSVTRLRALLATEHLIKTWPDGYSIEVSPEQTDLGRFQIWLQEAGRAAERDDPEKQAAVLAEALALWRGEPLSDVPSELLEREAVPMLREQRLAALERRIAADLRRGRDAALVAELRELTARYPLRERLWAQLMRALDASGRRADALDAYHVLRRRLAAELGIEPGAEVRQLQAAVLAGRAVAGGRSGSAPDLPVPRELPPEVPGFVGRADELARLDAVATQAADGVRVVVVAGTAGVGKTTLAARWARRAADRFPDGQLWLNLRGYDPGQPMPPEQALSRFLRALGVPGEKIPLDLADQTALYRSLTDGRRLLVVLDNASAAEQVRPLLPAGPGSLALVTSRSQLTGLVAGGADLLALDLLSGDDAWRVLVQRLGRGRVESYPSAAAEIIRRCVRLPLALAVVAARAASQPGFGLDTFAAQLAEGDLDGLSTGEPTSDVRTVFSWSYRALSPPAARLFRLLGLHPGPDLAAPAAGSLAGLPIRQVRTLLAELVRAHLLTEPTPGRFAIHDLLRAYASELAQDHEQPQERDAARVRLFDHYLHTTDAGVRLIGSPRHLLAREEPAPGTTLQELATAADADRWWEAERANLVAVVEQAAERGPRPVAWHLADAAFLYLLFHDQPTEWRLMAQSGLAAAQHAGDRAATAAMYHSLGTLHGSRGDHRAAIDHFEQALALRRQTGDLARESRTLSSLGIALGDACRFEEARTHLLDAHRLAQQLHDTSLRTAALGSLGVVCRLMGRLVEAAEHLTAVLALDREIADRRGEAISAENLGSVYTDLGRFPEAVGLLIHAVDISRQLGHRLNVAISLNSLGTAYLWLGRVADATECARESLELVRETGDQAAEIDSLTLLASCHRHAGELDQAITAAEQAVARAREIRHLHGETDALIELATTLVDAGDPGAAREHAERAVQLAESRGMRVLYGRALTALARSYFASGEVGLTVRYGRLALGIHRETGHRPGAAGTQAMLDRIDADQPA